MELSKDESILFKVYFENYTFGSHNKKLIIMITNDKSTFSANDRQ